MADCDQLQQVSAKLQNSNNILAFIKYWVAINSHNMTKLSPDNSAESLTLQAPEPVDEKLMVTIAQVCDRLQHMGKHSVGGLSREDGVLEQDQ